MASGRIVIVLHTTAAVRHLPVRSSSTSTSTSIHSQHILFAAGASVHLPVAQLLRKLNQPWCDLPCVAAAVVSRATECTIFQGLVRCNGENPESPRENGGVLKACPCIAGRVCMVAPHATAPLTPGNAPLSLLHTPIQAPLICFSENEFLKAIYCTSTYEVRSSTPRDFAFAGSCCMDLLVSHI